MPSTTNFQAPIFAGVDVGGTNIKFGLVDDLGNVISHGKFPTQPTRSPQIAIEQAKQELEQLLEPLNFTWADIAAVGLGTPGPMDIHDGTILTPTNLPGWHQFPIRNAMSVVFEKPVTYANDAGAAAFGEYWIGSGKQYQSMILLTLGTGVGGGIIVDDFSIDGAHSHGAEIGHMVIDTSPQARMCGCGKRGHIEAYASATAVVERTREAMADPKTCHSTILREQISESSPLSALMISNAAAQGDELASRIVSETARCLGFCIAQLAHIINPAAFILGGAMNFGGDETPLGRSFLNEIITTAKPFVFPVVGDNLIVKFAQCGSQAGFVGAAGLARAEFRRTSRPTTAHG